MVAVRGSLVDGGVSASTAGFECPLGATGVLVVERVVGSVERSGDRGSRYCECPPVCKLGRGAVAMTGNAVVAPPQGGSKCAAVDEVVGDGSASSRRSGGVSYVDAGERCASYEQSLS